MDEVYSLNKLEGFESDDIAITLRCKFSNTSMINTIIEKTIFQNNINIC